MATAKFTAADLRGLKAKREREAYEEIVRGICSAISQRTVAAATRGNSKLVTILNTRDGQNGRGNGVVLSYSDEYRKQNEYGQFGPVELTEGLIGDCILKLQEEFPDCALDGEMEEFVETRGPRAPPISKTRYTITVDWADATATAAAAAPEVSEIEQLRARISELERENAELKSKSPTGQMGVDLLDIFAGFGRIVDSAAAGRN